jgi:very-short-patch-repair endonuclease
MRDRTKKEHTQTISHHMIPGGRADAVRTSYLEAQGFRVKRYWNSELIENFHGVVEDICRELGR